MGDNTAPKCAGSNRPLMAINGQVRKAIPSNMVIMTPSTEQEVCISSLRLNILPKLTEIDAQKFDTLLKVAIAGIDQKVCSQL